MVEVHKVSGGAWDGNSFLIMAERPILVDTGMRAEPVIKNIRRHMDPSDLEMIVLTHCHHDHSGAAPALREATGAQVLIHHSEADLLGDDLTTLAYLFGEPAPEFEADSTMEEGQVLDLGNWKLTVLHTPGHSLGSICLFQVEEGVLFSGDTVFPDGNIGRTDLYGGSTEELVKSIERLASLEVRTLYPGHMETTDRDVPQQIRSSLQFARRML